MTPVQLVTMVSAMANGGVYLPPHVLLASADTVKGDPRLVPMAFHPENQLPATLPDGAHRVISELTSAKMRSMMHGIVVEGTGKNAALNGYTSAGKTGTAQKVDPVTHTYSHTKLVASFAGFAPVSNPAISVAVVIDTPQGTDVQRYGGYASAPVFAQVAQQVLEYLGVPHDEPLKSTKEMEEQRASAAGVDDRPEEGGADLQAMFAEVNDLPADDPLRQAAWVVPTASEVAASEVAEAGVPGQVGGTAAAPVHAQGRPPREDAGVLRLLPKNVLAAFRAHGGTTSLMPDQVDAAEAKLEAPKVRPVAEARGPGVVLDETKRVAVPSFTGEGLREVVERTGSAGLRVKPVGSGMAREQAPVAGTMVPVGTEVVVRFVR